MGSILPSIAPKSAAPRSGAGRPRKPGPRTPSGRPRRFVADQGEPLLLLRRLELVAPDRAAPRPDEQPADTLRRAARDKSATDRRSSYPLGVMLARRAVTSAQHYAGRRYHGLFVRAVRGIGIASVLAKFTGSGSISAAVHQVIGADQAAAESDTWQAYIAARAALHAAGQAARRAVEHVAVYEDGRATGVRLDALRRGLDALAAHFEGEDRRRGR